MAGKDDRSPLERIDAGWQKLEARLCAAVLVAEIASLTLWIALKGLSSDYKPGENASGLVFRALVSAAILGLVAHLATRKQAQRVNRIATTAAVVAGAVAGRLWAHAGVGYASQRAQLAAERFGADAHRGPARAGHAPDALGRAARGVARDLARAPHQRGRAGALRAREAALADGARRPGGGDARVLLRGARASPTTSRISVFRANATEPCPDDKSKSCDTSAGEQARDRRARVGHGPVPARPAGVARPAARFPRCSPGQPIRQVAHGGRVEHLARRRRLEGALRRERRWTRCTWMRRSRAATRMPQVAVPGTGEQARGLLVRELDFVFPVRPLRSSRSSSCCASCSSSRAR